MTLSAIKCALSYFYSLFCPRGSSILCGSISPPCENKVSGLGALQLCNYFSAVLFSVPVRTLVPLSELSDTKFPSTVFLSVLLLLEVPVILISMGTTELPTLLIARPSAALRALRSNSRSLGKGRDTSECCSAPLSPGPAACLCP